MAVTDQQPLVSIITPVRNGALYLEYTIQSVLEQDYPNIEHIIIDDGSTDDGATVEILKRYPHLGWRSQENKGVIATLNEGLAAASGSILGFIAADDMYTVPSAISAVANYWQSRSDLGCVYGRLLLVDKNGLPSLAQTHLTGPWSKWFLRYVFFTPLPSLFVSRELLNKENLWFDATLHLAADWDLAIRLSMTACKFGYLNQPLGMHRIHAGQLSRDQDAMRVERREICRRHGMNYPLLLMVDRMLSFRHKFIKVLWMLRTKGIKGLTDEIVGRLRRSNAEVDRLISNKPGRGS